MDSAASSSEQKTTLNLKKVLEDIFLVLTPKEKTVIIKRFSLDNEPRQTLEKIGQEFSVTRERIRQIEKIALGKLRRTLENTKLADVAHLAKELITAHGGVALEEQLVSEILQKLYSTSEIDGHIIRLALAIHPELDRTEKNGVFHPFIHLRNVKTAEVKKLCDTVYQVLSKKKDVMPVAELADEVQIALQ